MHYIILSLALLCANLVPQNFTSETTAHGLTIETTIEANDTNYIYKDFLKVSVDNPAVNLIQWQATPEAVSHYDSSFKENKKIYNRPITITAHVGKKNTTPSDAALHIDYLEFGSTGPETIVIPLKFAEASPEEKKAAHPDQSLPAPSKESLPADASQMSWSEYVSALIKNSNSIWLQLLLVFLLGMMLSLTPCIYPMIPITVGILQSQGSKSFSYNFLLALTYTLGMATTYAIFGLLASCIGPMCGQLLVHPLFVMSLVALLTYFAFSMIGLYDMYIPSIMQKQQSFKGGSFLSIFLFGAASGSIASPCVSPGLALVLAVVATLGNQFLGFVLLFAFGVGLSMPLMLIGTFSSSINMLPQAGMWMMEVKRLFGLLMLAMCFYYASYVTPITLLLWIAALLIAALGIFYISLGLKNPSSFWKKFNQLFGILLIAGSVITSFYAYKEMNAAEVCSLDDFWQTDYECARSLAIKENKKLFIDFWATFCPVCIAINKKVLPDPKIKNVLDSYINLKVDGTYSTSEPFASIKDTYDVSGFPVYIIVDPKTEKVLARFGSEIYDMDRAKFAKILERNK